MSLFSLLILVVFLGLEGSPWSLGMKSATGVWMPTPNIRTMKPCITLYPFEQVVCEETPEPKVYGARTGKKQRFMAGIVTPAQPHYMYGLLDAGVDPPLGETPPILAVATSAGGYKAGFLVVPALVVPAQVPIVCLGLCFWPHFYDSPEKGLRGGSSSGCKYVCGVFTG